MTASLAFGDQCRLEAAYRYTSIDVCRFRFAIKHSSGATTIVCPRHYCPKSLFISVNLQNKYTYLGRMAENEKKSNCNPRTSSGKHVCQKLNIDWRLPQSIVSITSDEAMTTIRCPQSKSKVLYYTVWSCLCSFPRLFWRPPLTARSNNARCLIMMMGFWFCAWKRPRRSVRGRKAETKAKGFNLHVARYVSSWHCKERNILYIPLQMNGTRGTETFLKPFENSWNVPETP